ncbi:DUF6146 family protein [Polaribacter tangerinus]|uniref:DUF6146 family protein n=1 Tax=Polaribacter tangerinus TaxID=1920034 RepID=UPI000B4B7C3F|nr:DUF6146 family protein [Polaribacter tangerinus]
MKFLANCTVLFLTAFFIAACSSNTIFKKNNSKEEPVVIANDSLEYEIIIIDVGFNAFLNSIAEPEGFYSQEYMEARNRAWVITWNQRAENPTRFNNTIYENSIDYQPTIDYGYEVNYKLFNYFLFAQRKYKMSLGGGFRTNRIR